MRLPAVRMSDEDLRPAYLMLASCYNDIARQEQHQGVSGTEHEYRKKAEECLRNVYGTDVPPVPFPAYKGDALASSVKASKTKATKTIPDDLAAALSAKTALEREVQSLRDRHANNVANLTEARKAKRLLEDDLEDERIVRRKLEAEIAQHESELKALRHAEDCALEQCKREVEMRRMAEEQADEARDLRYRVRALREDLDESDRQIRDYGERDGKRRDLCAKAGALLMKAARGEFEDIGNVLHTSPPNPGWAFSTSSSMEMGRPGPSSDFRRERTPIVASPRGYRERERTSPFGR